MEEKLWKRNHGVVMLDGRLRQRHPRVTEKLHGDSLGGAGKYPGATQMHPEAIQRDHGARHETREPRNAKLQETIKFSRKNNGGDPFCVDGSDVTLTVTAACAQK